MTLLESHLEQISLSSAAIGELPPKRFPQPKVFTNAILRYHDITALIRDTEAHERALFTLASADETLRPAPRRTTVHAANGSANLARHDGHRQKSAVATLLGGDLGEQVRKQTAKTGSERGELDVNVLLNGAARLCEIYPIQGGPERISALRSRHEQLSSSIGRHESRVAKQMAQLANINKQRDGIHEGEPRDEDDEDDDKRDGPPLDHGEMQVEDQVTEEDIRREEEEIRSLEEKKRALEDRVSGMERDLGGLMR